MSSLRALLIQRAARLQGWPALTAGGWGTLPYPAFRNRVEGIALGIMALDPPLGSPVHSDAPGPWGWAAEVACACCGLCWDPRGEPLDPALMGGGRFNDEEGRQPYHDRDHALDPATAFLGTLTHGELEIRLRRLNGRLGWDHGTTLTLPLDQTATPAGRGALWSALFGGSHAILAPGKVPQWDPEPFRDLLDPPL